MAKMGRSSRSFLRFREYSIFLGDVRAYESMTKADTIAFMHRENIDDRAIFFAENIAIMSKKEIKNTVKELADKLKSISANGVIEIHPTADGTSKSAHIHYWGKFNKEVEDIIIEYIKNNRLSNKSYLNYTSDKIFKKDKIHKLLKNGELVEYKFNKDEKTGKIKRETISTKYLDEDEIAIENAAYEENSYKDIIEYYENILKELDIDDNTGALEGLEKNNLSISDIDYYIMELELEIGRDQ